MKIDGKEIFTTKIDQSCYDIQIGDKTVFIDGSSIQDAIQHGWKAHILDADRNIVTTLGEGSNSKANAIQFAIAELNMPIDQLVEQHKELRKTASKEAAKKSREEQEETLTA